MITKPANAASRIVKLRGVAGLSQRQAALAATKAGIRISQASISLMENGKATVSGQYLRWLEAWVAEATVTVPACPDCGAVHTGRCNGKQGKVVVVASDEQVVPKRPAVRRKPRPRKAIFLPAAVFDELNARRQAQNLSWETFLAKETRE